MPMNREPFKAAELARLQRAVMLAEMRVNGLREILRLAEVRLSDAKADLAAAQEVDGG